MPVSPIASRPSVSQASRAQARFEELMKRLDPDDDWKVPVHHWKTVSTGAQIKYGGADPFETLLQKEFGPNILPSQVKALQEFLKTTFNVVVTAKDLKAHRFDTFAPSDNGDLTYLGKTVRVDFIAALLAKKIKHAHRSYITRYELRRHLRSGAPAS